MKTPRYIIEIINWARQDATVIVIKNRYDKVIGLNYRMGADESLKNLSEWLYNDTKLYDKFLEFSLNQPGTSRWTIIKQVLRNEWENIDKSISNE